ncbi:MAG: PAS domain S-box protein [Deltaproteobacteria bacterium]|nr:PAS domain S-box protein [Deltaproteobacteria bacterium]
MISNEPTQSQSASKAGNNNATSQLPEEYCLVTINHSLKPQTISSISKSLQQNISLHQFKDLEAAKDYLSQNQPDSIVADLDDQEKDIRNLARCCRAPKILITSKEDIPDQDKLKLAGVHELVLREDLPNAAILTHHMQQAAERFALEENLKASSEKHFQEIIENSSEAIIVVNPDNTIFYTNPAANNLIGFENKKSTGQKLELHFHSLDGLQKSAELTSLDCKRVSFLAQTQETTEISIKTSYGEERAFDLRVTDVKWGFLKGYLIALHDITNIKRISQLTAEIQEKSRLDKLKDEFISIVSHEMRTPLTIVKGAVSNIKDGIAGPVTDMQKKVLETTNRNVDRLARIINDLLDLSRLESGKAKMNRKPFHANKFVEEIHQNFKNIAEEKSLSMQMQNNCPDDLLIYGDYDMITQVVTNLLSNALRYAQSSISIELSPTRGESMGKETDIVTFSISDDGEGIPLDKQANLFEKFEQINRPSGGSGYKGTGLGLAISQQIVQMHHGNIWVESDANKGAKFKFTIPVYHQEDELLFLVENLIDQADKTKDAASLMVINIKDHAIVLEKCDEEEIALLYSELINTLRNQALRKSDVLHFRRDTKQLVVVLPNTDRKIAEQIAARICKLTRNAAFSCQNTELNLELVIGIACFPDDATHASDLLKQALQGLST